MIDCIFATYSALPDLDPHDRLVLEELRRRGLSAEAGIWDDPAVDWAAAWLCVVRSTWDYPKNHRAFLAWLDRVARLTMVCNDPETMSWNVHKFFLRDLEEAGVPIIPTAWLNRGEAVQLDELMAARRWNDIIIKPAYGGSSINVMHLTSPQNARDRGQRHLEHLLADQDVLVQPFLTSLAAYPERALMFIDGVYSHTVTKTPFQTALSNGEAGDAPIVEATAQEIAVATRALRVSPKPPMYARVDLVRDANQIRVMELELIEPTLFLAMHPPSIGAFADAIIARLNERRFLCEADRMAAQRE